MAALVEKDQQGTKLLRNAEPISSELLFDGWRYSLFGVIRWLKLARLAFLIWPTARVLDRYFLRAELAPGKFLSRRLRWHSCFCERIFQPAKGAAAENAGAGPGAQP